MKERTHKEVLKIFGAVNKIGNAMSEDSRQASCSPSLESMKAQLRVAKATSKKRGLSGKNDWSDHYRKQHIEELELEIQSIKANSQEQES